MMYRNNQSNAAVGDPTSSSPPSTINIQPQTQQQQSVYYGAGGNNANNYFIQNSSSNNSLSSSAQMYQNLYPSFSITNPSAMTQSGFYPTTASARNCGPFDGYPYSGMTSSGVSPYSRGFHGNPGTSTGNSPFSSPSGNG